MSRYTLENKALTIVVGWDDPMQTFFAQVWDGDDNQDDADALLWIGLDYGEVQDVSVLAELVRPYARLSFGLRRKLRRDFRRRKRPTKAQEFAREAFFGKWH